jgi:hypothetical protein
MDKGVALSGKIICILRKKNIHFSIMNIAIANACVL